MVSQRSRFMACVGVVLVVLFLLTPHSYNGAHEIEYLRPKLGMSKRPNGVIFMLLPPNRLLQACRALRNVEDRFNRRLKYPYVLFTAESEGEAPLEIKEKIHWITEGRATFASVPQGQWGVPDGFDKSLVASSLKNIGFTAGYRSMCRFYSGFFWRHPALAKYDWLWRLDTDIEFHCDIPYDPIERVASQNALYGYVQVTGDGEWVQPSLASNVSRFMGRHRELISSDANLGFAWKGIAGITKALEGTAGNSEWSGKVMYNNFEISHRSIWESRLYRLFFEFLDGAGGFFYERWGDAPVHSYGLAMLLRKDQVIQLNDTGYQHQQWAYSCPDRLELCSCEKKEFDDGAKAWTEPPH